MIPEDLHPFFIDLALILLATVTLVGAVASGLAFFGDDMLMRLLIRELL